MPKSEKPPLTAFMLTPLEGETKDEFKARLIKGLQERGVIKDDAGDPASAKPLDAEEEGSRSVTIDANEELCELLNSEVLFNSRKQFGMFGQVQFRVTDVTREMVSVSISTHRKLEGSVLAVNVRNTMLNFLRDMLPCPKYRALYSNEALGVSDVEYEHAFYTGSRTGERESSEILIEKNAGPAREGYRARMAEVWNRLVAEQED